MLRLPQLFAESEQNTFTHGDMTIKGIQGEPCETVLAKEYDVEDNDNKSVAIFEVGM